jgi:hypothetical protein
MCERMQTGLFESNAVYLRKDDNSLLEEAEKLKILKQEIEYLLEKYSTISVSNIRVKDGLISPLEYLKSLKKIVETKANDTRFGKLLDEFSENVSQLTTYLLVNKMLFRYGLRKRPLMPGAIALGFIENSWKVHPKFTFGTIDYPMALSKEQIADYELVSLFVHEASIKWCIPEQKKALELGIELPEQEINYQEAIFLIRRMKSAQNKLPNSLQKHWETMIKRVVNAFGTEFENLLWMTS